MEHILSYLSRVDQRERLRNLLQEAFGWELGPAFSTHPTSLLERNGYVTLGSLHFPIVPIKEDHKTKGPKREWTPEDFLYLDKSLVPYSQFEAQKGQQKEGLLKVGSNWFCRLPSGLFAACTGPERKCSVVVDVCPINTFWDFHRACSGTRCHSSVFLQGYPQDLCQKAKAVLSQPDSKSSDAKRSVSFDITWKDAANLVHDTKQYGYEFSPLYVISDVYQLSDENTQTAQTQRSAKKILVVQVVLYLGEDGQKTITDIKLPVCKNGEMLLLVLAPDSHMTFVGKAPKNLTIVQPQKELFLEHCDVCERALH
jgi:hypothetical protein